MFELIRANKRNSIILILMMAAVLCSLGYIIGNIALAPPPPASYYKVISDDKVITSGQEPNYGGLWGVAVAAAIWFFLTIASLAGGDQILLSVSKAIPVSHADHPQLFNIVEEMAIAAGLPMPKVYVIADPALNAFATGRSPKSASVAVTAGLLGRLNRDELQGVIAHEMSHILHRDILFVTLAGIMLGSIVLISDIFLRGMFYGRSSGRRFSSGSDKSSQAAIIMMIIAVVAAILAPIMAQLLYFALSRRREYLADAGSARLTRYPEGLASALEKIAASISPQLSSANRVTAPMYIINPFKKQGMPLSDLTSTHPPISERIRILRNITHGASFKDYSDSFRDVTGKKNVSAGLSQTQEDIPLRQASEETMKKQTIENQTRQVGDIMRQVNGFAFLTCSCGLKLKVPPDYKGNKVGCPRCRNILTLQDRKI